jgi:hypothetical protein
LQNKIRNDKETVYRITFTPTLILPPQGGGNEMGNPPTMVEEIIIDNPWLKGEEIRK